MSVNFFDQINSIVPLSSECNKAISSITEHRKIPKKTILLRNGHICHHFHYIEKGLARAFYYKDGKDVTAWFAAENHIISAIDSLFTGQPTMYNIELLEDCTIWSLNYSRIEPIFEQFPKVERLGRLLVTQNYLLLDERTKGFAFSSAEERYELLLKQIPDILNRTKLGYIASYIGISQEYLSRLRGGFRGDSHDK